MAEAHAWPDDRPVRCAKCGWTGDDQDLEAVCTFPGRWYGDPPEPPEYEAFCPECNHWEYIEDVDDEQ